MKLRTKAAVLLGAGVLILGIASTAFATGASDDGVVPVLHDSANITTDGNGNNDKANCDLGDALELDGTGSGTTTNGVTVHMSYDGTTKAVSFTVDDGVVTIAYVKGGNAYNEYDYGSAGVNADGDLFAPDNASDGPAGLSHAVFCTGPAAQGESNPPTDGGSNPPTDGNSQPPSNPPTDGNSQPPSNPPTDGNSQDPSQAPSFSGGVGGETSVPTEPNTATVGSGSTGGPSGGAWLLVAAVGVLLASVVVMTPARAKTKR